jgi:hypothetical protein
MLHNRQQRNYLQALLQMQAALPAAGLHQPLPLPAGP